MELRDKVPFLLVLDYPLELPEESRNGDIRWKDRSGTRHCLLSNDFIGISISHILNNYAQNASEKCWILIRIDQSGRRLEAGKEA